MIREAVTCYRKLCYRAYFFMRWVSIGSWGMRTSTLSCFPLYLKSTLDSDHMKVYRCACAQLNNNWEHHLPNISLLIQNNTLPTCYRIWRSGRETSDHFGSTYSQSVHTAHISLLVFPFKGHFLNNIPILFDRERYPFACWIFRSKKSILCVPVYQTFIFEKFKVKNDFRGMKLRLK